MILGPVTDRRLQGHVLHGFRGHLRLVGEDAEGRILGRACTSTGKEDEAAPLVEVRRDDWEQLDRLLRREGR